MSDTEVYECAPWKATAIPDYSCPLISDYWILTFSDTKNQKSHHMAQQELFIKTFGREELALLKCLTTPFKIQTFLLDLPYSADERYRSPRSVIRDRTAHCFDGSLFAAAALRYIGYPPLIVDLLPNDRDDDHIIAVYRRQGRWGAVAKSNFSGLTFREPVYRTLRELVMSYFEQFYNVQREKTLRQYTVHLNLRSFDKLNWMGSDENLDAIAERLDEIRKISLLSPTMVRGLSPIDERSYQAGLLGANWDGLYKP